MRPYIHTTLAKSFPHVWQLNRAACGVAANMRWPWSGHGVVNGCSSGEQKIARRLLSARGSSQDRVTVRPRAVGVELVFICQTAADRPGRRFRREVRVMHELG